MILKKALTAVALCAAAIGLTSCETQTLKGNHNVGMGNMTYYYAYVQSHVIAPAYLTTVRILPPQESHSRWEMNHGGFLYRLLFLDY